MAARKEYKPGAGHERSRELAIVAASRLEVLLDQVLATIEGVNNELFVLQAQINAHQAVNPDAVCLELYGCGKECTGCPHLSWTKYRWKITRAGEKLLLSAPLNGVSQDPSRAIPRSHPRQAELLALVRQVKNASDKKSKILEQLRPLWNLTRPDEPLP